MDKYAGAYLQYYSTIIVQMILESTPRIEEKFCCKLPFYFFYGMFCNIAKTREANMLIFCRGKELTIACPQLNIKKRRNGCRNLF